MQCHVPLGRLTKLIHEETPRKKYRDGHSCSMINSILQTIRIPGSHYWDYSVWWLMCQRQVSRAGTSNYIPQYLWDVITCPCPWCLLLAHQSSYDIEWDPIKITGRCHGVPKRDGSLVQSRLLSIASFLTFKDGNMRCPLPVENCTWYHNDPAFLEYGIRINAVYMRSRIPHVLAQTKT